MTTINPEQVAKLPRTIHESELARGFPVLIRAIKPAGTNLWILERVAVIKKIKAAWWHRKKTLCVLNWRPLFKDQWYISCAEAEKVARNIVAQRADTHELKISKDVIYGKNAVPFFKKDSPEAKMVDKAMQNTVEEVFPPDRKGMNQPQ